MNAFVCIDKRQIDIIEQTKLSAKNNHSVPLECIFVVIGLITKIK